jgi:GntR family transcriptional repressor for pyruvate dehydrogenase complex
MLNGMFTDKEEKRGTLSKTMQPLVRYRLYEQIIEIIKTEIQEGHLKPGDLLPSERALAKSLGVSRVPVREAMRMLEAMGVVEIFHGKGAVVAGLGRMAIIELLDVIAESDSDTLADLAEARLVMEVAAAALSCVRRTDDDIARMKNAITMMEAEVRGGLQGINSSLEFHKALVRASKNKVLYRFCVLFTDLSREARKISMSRPGRKEQALSQHRQILEAVIDRNVNQAVTEMEIHIRGIRIHPKEE